MKRGFGKEKTIELLNYMRQKENSFVRSAVIVGHPGESEEDFIELKEFLEDFGFDRFSVFEYSNEENTTAYTMEQIEPEVIRERADILGKIAEESMQKSLKKLIGKEIELVIDGISDEHEFLLSARALDWAPEIDGEILINDSKDFSVEHGDFFKAEVTEVAGVVALATLKERI
jgi:tRNA A37 methylthiotransferase MiaB